MQDRARGGGALPERAHGEQGGPGPKYRSGSPGLIQGGADGDAIRGTWRRYDLSDGRPATGAWVANRRPRGGGPSPESP